jgi:hypothetical protein
MPGGGTSCKYEEGVENPMGFGVRKDLVFVNLQINA